MAYNRMVIGNSKERNKKDTEPVLKDIAAITPQIAPSTEQEPVQESIDEEVWGNDHSILKKLDEEQVTNRRRYVRTIYIQNIECHTILDSIQSEPTLLVKPIIFMVVDISMGGVGIICEHEISVGKVLIFKLILDNISYDVMYEVVYCFPSEGRFRAGLKILQKDKLFIRHLKILVARISLQSKYGTAADTMSENNK